MTAGDIVSVKAEVTTQETITILTSKTFVVTLEMRELMVQLAPVLGGTSAPPPPCESTITTIMGTG